MGDEATSVEMETPALSSPSPPSQRARANESKMEAWMGVIKLFIGYVFATVITTVASCHLKSVEFNQADRNLERDFLSKHFDYITDPKNKDNRLLLAQYCATVFGGRWEQYSEKLQNENADILKKK